ncbi:hypothetical protein OPAG_09131 [Rhodococcus opacus PD630]|nr:hypothetical protein Pd630_LPD03762 [Rhodococcus opacus PD630]EHI47259.1 hypothetical protein OPAG_09131 [Rhodococcus opacus PD630]
MCGRRGRATVTGRAPIVPKSIDDHQDRFVRGQAVEHRTQLRLVVRQRLVVDLLSGGGQSGGVVFAFSHVDAAKHGVTRVHSAVLRPASPVADPASIPDTHVTR